MKIVALIKNVPDTETKIKIIADGTDIDTQGIKYVMNPFDEFAVEEALRIKEKLADDSVVVAVQDVPAGAPVMDNVIALEPIQPGHKVAVLAIRAGEYVTKFGQPIGRATRDITSCLVCNAARQTGFRLSPRIRLLA